MPLVRISDLNGPSAHVVDMIEKAKSLSILYDQYANDEDDGAHRAAGIHASELSPCLRKVVYSLLATEKKKNLSKFWRQRFRVGSAVHGWLQDDFHRIARRTKSVECAQQMAIEKGWTLEFESEAPVSPKHQEIAKRFHIHSSCDGVFTFRDPTGTVMLRVGLEIKTENADSYEKLRAPKPEHVEQGHIYMACLDVPLMWFMYFSKGTQNNTPSHGPWLVPFDSRIWAIAEVKCVAALEHAREARLPLRTETIVCQFCPYAYDCQPQILKSGGKKTLESMTIRGGE
jgi:hypothetical protein